MPTIRIAAYNPCWPDLFDRGAKKIRAALGPSARRIEHVGSTSVPCLAAKPVIDILLAVADSSEESTYAPPLISAGYTLLIREIDWHQHRMFKGDDPEVNLHVFSLQCPEIDRMLAFRDWLRRSAADRALYERAKRDLAAQPWNEVQHYADAKSGIVEEILTRARPIH